MENLFTTKKLVYRTVAEITAPGLGAVIPDTTTQEVLFSLGAKNVFGGIKPVSTAQEYQGGNFESMRVGSETCRSYTVELANGIKIQLAPGTATDPQAQEALRILGNTDPARTEQAIKNVGSKESGFTLMEIMVVIAMVALLAALAMPVVDHIKRASASEAEQWAPTIINGINAKMANARLTAEDMLDDEHLGQYNCLSMQLSDCDEANSLTKIISLQFPKDANFWYSVSSGVDEDGNLHHCITATSTSNAAGTILYSSRKTTAAGWEGNSSFVKYIDNATDHKGGGHCTENGEFNAECLSCN